jgi:hypothetical protein
MLASAPFYKSLKEEDTKEAFILRHEHRDFQNTTRDSSAISPVSSTGTSAAMSLAASAMLLSQPFSIRLGTDILNSERLDTSTSCHRSPTSTEIPTLLR